jgi:hypothetical protein
VTELGSENGRLPEQLQSEAHAGARGTKAVVVALLANLGIGREGPGAQHPAHLTHRRGHVHAGVGVHAPGDWPGLLGDPGHNLSFLAIPPQAGKG